MNDDDNGSGRDETSQERADRKWGDLLQELRVMQTGVQLLAGFLLTLPFQQKFEDLDEFQRDFYLVLVVVAGVTTALVLTPVAAHRTLSGRQVKERLVRTAGILASIALGAVSLLVVGITTFIFDVVVDRTWAVVVGAAMAVVLVALLVLLPRRLITKDLV
ncbi:MAG TPA: DUF6328 family protein [Nocardioides sp.]|nr:DUF6328 family protein [Nocardioides sp.]